MNKNQKPLIITAVAVGAVVLLSVCCAGPCILSAIVTPVQNNPAPQQFAEPIAKAQEIPPPKKVAPEKIVPDDPPVAKKASKPGRVYVSRKMLGEKWPLTIDDGEIECLKGYAIIFHSGTSGGIYAVNGGAIDMKKWQRIDLIWDDAPRSEYWIKNNIPAIKKDMGPLLAIGQECCQKQR